MRRIVFFATLVALLSSCKDVDFISEKPPELSGSYVYEQQVSTFGVRFDVDLRDIEVVVNDLLDDPIEGKEGGEFSETYTVKTKNPLYNPNKWSKTRDPLYNKNKWIKVGFIKTKNPLYHPNKWIKTKNPAYNPSEWLYSSASVDIGYQAEYSVTLSEPVSFTAVGTDSLEIVVPLSVDGSAGFEGDLAKIGMVDNKNFDADADVSFIVGIDFAEDWCPKLDVSTDIDWRNGPKIEVVGGVWLDLNLAAELSNLGLEPEIEKAIESAIDCEAIRSDIANVMVPSSVPFSNELGGLSLSVNPLTVYKPIVSFYKDQLMLDIATDIELGITSQAVAEDPKPLPNLVSAPQIENLIRVALPLALEYKDLESALNARINEMNREIENKLIENPVAALETVNLINFDVYPSGDRVALGVEFSLKTGVFLNPKGTIYLTARPDISDSNVLTLTDVQINGDFTNSAYDAALIVFRDYLENRVHEAAVIDFDERLRNQVQEAMSKVQEQLADVNGVTVEVLEPVIDLSSEFVNSDRSMIKTVFVTTGIDVRIHPIEITAL